jgi:hypothetical protein
MFDCARGRLHAVAGCKHAERCPQQRTLEAVEREAPRMELQSPRVSVTGGRAPRCTLCQDKCSLCLNLLLPRSSRNTRLRTLGVREQG